MIVAAIRNGDESKGLVVDTSLIQNTRKFAFRLLQFCTGLYTFNL